MIVTHIFVKPGQINVCQYLSGFYALFSVVMREQGVTSQTEYFCHDSDECKKYTLWVMLQEHKNATVEVVLKVSTSEPEKAFFKKIYL